MRSLCSGVTRAKTEKRWMSASSISWGMKSRSAPVRAASPSRKMPTALATATAVRLWSPVIITGLMPALRQLATARGTSRRGRVHHAHQTAEG